MKKSEEYKIAERRQNFRNSIPGIKKLEAAKAEQAAFDEAYKLALNYGIGKFPAEPESDLEALEVQYPMANALLCAETYSDSPNAVKAEIGQKAVENILDGADWENEVKKMKKQWRDYVYDLIDRKGENEK